MTGTDAQTVPGTLRERYELVRARAADAAVRAGRGCACAQPLVEDVAVDHADEAALDRDVDHRAGGRHHPRGGCARNQQRVGDRVVADQPRRNRATAGLDAPGAVEQQNLAALPGQGFGCRGARRAPADHHCVEGFDRRHRVHPRSSGATRNWPTPLALAGAASVGSIRNSPLPLRPMRAAMRAAATKSTASAAKTAA